MARILPMHVAAAIHRGCRRWAEALVDFAYPPACACCRAPLSMAGPRFCLGCWRRMRRLIASAATRCPRCGSPQVSPLLCGNCDAWEVAFERAVVLAPYADPWAQAIQALKFGGRRSLGPLLGRFMARQLAAELAAVEALVPVPLYPARQRERGFNQSRLIATGLAGELGVPVLDGLLVRRLPTRQQARLGAVARRDNLVEAIACGRAPPRDLTLCLVDDVMTTGATLDACALALRRAGARPVVAATLAAAYG